MILYKPYVHLERVPRAKGAGQVGVLLRYAIAVKPNKRYEVIDTEIDWDAKNKTLTYRITLGNDDSNNPTRIESGAIALARSQYKDLEQIVVEVKRFDKPDDEGTTALGYEDADGEE